MKVVLIPGPRDEELIFEIRKAKETMEHEEYIDYMKELAASGEEYIDAMYYACNNRDVMLEEQAKYFYDCLLNDESYYYAVRMSAIDKLVTDHKHLDRIAGRFGDKYFTIHDHSDGWDYYCTDSDYCIIEEGIIDYADAPLAEVLSELFQHLSIDAEDFCEMDHDELVERIEAHTRVC